MIALRIAWVGVFAGLLAAVAASGAPTIQEEPSLAVSFAERGVEGCFVLLDPESGALRIYNRQRAATRLLPASTFKIANALIGLETRAVGDVDETLPYGGTQEVFDAWERDMSLREAMKASNVAVFHQLAKRIGLPRMEERLQAFGYGNAAVGEEIGRRFWLEGPLAISAIEQVDFLGRLSAGRLPVEAANLVALKEILEYESTSDYTLYAKSGWGGPRNPQTGWWVGWVEKDGRRYPFALNMDVPTLDDAKHRAPVALECLAALGAL